MSIFCCLDRELSLLAGLETWDSIEKFLTNGHLAVQQKAAHKNVWTLDGKQRLEDYCGIYDLSKLLVNV